MSERKLHFETLQLHVGQEQADPVTDSRACRSTRPPPMCSPIPRMPLTALP